MRASPPGSFTVELGEGHLSSDLGDFEGATQHIGQMCHMRPMPLQGERQNNPQSKTETESQWGQSHGSRGLLVSKIESLPQRYPHPNP